MCADTMATSSITWEYANKLTPISNNALLGCAGTDNYISLFTRFIQNEFEKRNNRDYFDLIQEAILSYSQSIYESNKRSGLADLTHPPFEGIDIEKLCYPEGVLVAYDSEDKEYHIFKVQPPLPPKEVGYPHRATAGSGGIAADIFLKNTEYLLSKIGYTWSGLSSSLIAQFCFVLMHRIAYVEPHTSGLLAYRLNESRSDVLSSERVFGKLGKGDHYLRVLIEAAISEIGTDKLGPLAEEYMLSGFVKKLQPILAS